MKDIRLDLHLSTTITWSLLTLEDTLVELHSHHHLILHTHLHNNNLTTPTCILLILGNINTQMNLMQTPIKNMMLQVTRRRKSSIDANKQNNNLIHPQKTKKVNTERHIE
jgi:hypothetical protein